MKFGIFYEHQLPRPWDEGAELRLYQEALDQVELADRLGIDYAWEVEHHFLEEYSHSPAPEVFLGACSQRTKRIRLGHGIVLMPPQYNHPAKVAARIATLDLVSNGRVEFGTGESASRAELEGYGIDPAEEARHVARGDRAGARTCSRWIRTPATRASTSRCRAATSCRSRCRSRIRRCGWRARTARRSTSPRKLGLGALTFAFVDPTEARHWVDDYYETFERECVPIGWMPNPNIAMVTGFSCHRGRGGGAPPRPRRLPLLRLRARRTTTCSATTSRGGRTSGRASRACATSMPDMGPIAGGIGTPDELRAHLRKFDDDRRRSGDLHPAGRPQSPRSHLRIARALRRAT